MSKSQSKKSKKGQRVPNIPQISTVRPRLDALWSDEALLEQDTTTLLADLDGVTQGVKPPQLLPIVLTAYYAAPDSVQERLDKVLPQWLEQHNYLATLRQLITRNALEESQLHLALVWLQAAGDDISTLAEQLQQSSFYRAYYCRDGSDQAELFVFWYTDRRQNRVQAFDFLIDHNPPWNGAVKDGTIMQKRKPDQAVERLFESWALDRSTPLEMVDASTAHRILIEAMERNRQTEIRLPFFFAARRDEIAEHVLSLPPAPETPLFTADDLDYLVEEGRSAEDLRDYEEDVGYYVRSPDGTQRFVPHKSEDEDEDEDEGGEEAEDEHERRA